MSNIAFLFSGQGSQYVGMGKELYDNYKSARMVFDSASDILGKDIASMCFNGPESELVKTENTQPAIVVTSLAVAAVLNEYGIEPKYAAGLSLGEYSALIYGKVFNMAEGLKLIQKRGKIMQDAVPEGYGAMSAIMGLDAKAIEECCMTLKDEGVVEVANYNCPGQIVISGEKNTVLKASERLKAAGALKTIMLNVSGPFHSSLLGEAGEELEKEIKKVQMNAPDLKIIANYDNEFYTTDIADTVSKLKNQISSSVRWEDNIHTLIENGADTFIEAGPGRALTTFMKKIDRTKIAYNIEDIKSLEKLLKDFGKI